MLNETLLDTLYTTTETVRDPLLHRAYFFHDVRVHCHTNHPVILNILDRMLGFFPTPASIRGEANYYVTCYERAADFPLSLPAQRIRTETVRLLTNTKLKYYVSRDYAMEYHSYRAEPGVNGPALSIIHSHDHNALTQLAMLEQYDFAFLRRYVLLLALGQLMHHHGFEPCHAAAITAPWDNNQGALILGPSESGKTTLSLGCASTGYGLLGDDLVMLRMHQSDGQVHVHSITQEVSVRSGTLALWDNLSFLHTYPADARDKRYCTIEQIRAGAMRTQAPIQLLIFPSLTTAATSSITPLSKATTLHELIDLCLSSVKTSPQAQEQLFFLLSTLSEQARGYRLAIARDTNDGPALMRSLFAGGTHV
jgi:hypothetical protein